MRLPLRTVRARLTLWYSLLLSIPLAAFAVTSYVVFSQALYSRTDAFISDALSVFAREATSERRVLTTRNDAIGRTLREVRFRELDIIVLESSGTLLAMTTPDRENPAAPDAKGLIAAAAAADAAETPRSIVLGGNAFRIVTRPFESSEGRLTVAGVYPLREVVDTLARIRKMFLIVIPLLILSAAIGGWFLAKRSLAPVTAMATRAAEIGTSTLNERLPVGADDELGGLALVLNSLLDRLELAFEQQRRFMTDASHELRTPSAVMRAEADVTLSRPQRSEDEYRESMTVVRDAARRLTRIVDDIFLLARADAGQLVMQQSAMDLADVVVEAVRAIQAIAKDRQVRLEAPELVGARMSGDADLFGRVFLNLLDNAVKHTPAGGAVTVRMAARASATEIRVEDTGTGIPAESRERVFERFYRVDTARSREERATSSGAGLGLAIARRIVEMHGGTLSLTESRPGRTEFLVVVPGRTASAS